MALDLADLWSEPLAVEAREDDLLSVFDDGRDGAYGYCACLRFTHAQPTLRQEG